MAPETFKVILAQKTQRTPTVASFRFSSAEKISFLPGQFLKIILDENQPENKELNKFLSFSCSPGNNYVEVTKRLSASLFSQSLSALKLNDCVLIQAPFGNCVFKEEYKKISFLIGGIGITPVISIIEYIINKRLDTDMLLFYSNRTEEEIAFRQELDIWAKSNSNLKLYYTLTDCQPKDNSCSFGRINKELLLDKIKDPQERVFFTFGPPKMVEAMNELCLEIGCPKQNLRTESFTGY